MGTWGTSAFDDDGSMDLALMLDHPRGGLKAVRKELDHAIRNARYASAMSAFAAAEIVYAAHSGDAKRVPAEVKTWLKKHAGSFTKADLTKAAAVARTMLDHDEQRGWRDATSQRSFARKVKSLQKRICQTLLGTRKLSGPGGTRVKFRRPNPVGSLLYALASAGR